MNSYETTVEERSDGQFEVIVTTIDATGSQRMEVGTHRTRARAELAASVISRSARRYEGVGDSRAEAPTWADPSYRRPT